MINAMSNLQLVPVSLDRMVAAVENVRKRLIRATDALTAAGIPHAVAGGNAVAAWVSRVDVTAVRNTADIDLLIRRSDLERVKAALVDAGFVYRHAAKIDFFTDGPDGKFRDGVHLLMAGERVRPEYASPLPDVEPVDEEGQFRIVPIEALVEMKLNSWRIKDRMHLIDMIDIDLIDQSWPARFEPLLGERLQELLDNPES